MGWFTNIFKNKKENMQYAQMLNGSVPIYSGFGTNIYASDVVQQAVKCIVDELKKLRPLHIIDNGTDIVPVNDNIQNVLNNPNEIMVTSEFIEKIVWTLFLKYNSFVIPSFYEWIENGRKKRKYISLLPIWPQQVIFEEDLKGDLYVKFIVAKEEYEIKYSEIIHLRMNYCVDEYMGGNEFGEPDYSALLKTLQINDDILDGVSKATKSSYAINGIVKINTFMDDGAAEENLKRLQNSLLKNESGFITLDNKNTYIPINKQIALVDDKTLKFIDEKILRNFGVPLPILTGDYTKAQYESFYQKTLEPIITQLSQVFTKALMTEQQKAKGHKISFFPKDLIFMSMNEKLEAIRLLGDSGTLYENEKRTAVGLAPRPELVGIRMQSLNYINVNIAEKYQLGEKDDENEE